MARSVALTFSQGKIVEATSSNTPHLNEVLDSDEGARYVGEFAIGFHASLIDTSELMAVHPKGVDPARFAQSRGSKEQSGVAGNPAQSSADLGRELLAMRVDAATKRMKAEIGTH